MDMIKGAAELRRLFAERSPNATTPVWQPIADEPGTGAIYRWLGIAPPDAAADDPSPVDPDARG